MNLKIIKNNFLNLKHKINIKYRKISKKTRIKKFKNQIK